MTDWLFDRETDWTQGNARRALLVFAKAYSRRETVEPFAAAVGLDWQAAPASGAPDDLWLWVLQEAAHRGQVLLLAVMALKDPGIDQLHRVFSELITGGPDGMSPTSLQAATDASGLDDPDTFMRAQTDARNRIALIEIKGRGVGTGVLVGPKLVLTAAHVLGAYDSWPPEVKPAEVTVVLDYVLDGSRAAAEVSPGIRVARFLDYSLPTEAEAGGQVWAKDWNAPPDRLDFAVLELEQAAGPRGSSGNEQARGYYPLHEIPYAFGQAALLLVMQHPLAMGQKLGYILRPPKVNENETRIRYQGVTLGGSSGGAVFDPRGRLVALHHSGTDQGVHRYNEGVPISAIAQQVLNGPNKDLFTASGDLAVATEPAATDRVVAASDAFAASQVPGTGAFVDRESLRGHMRDLAKGSARLLVITGGKDSGKSYSYQLISYIASQAGSCATIQKLAPAGIEAFYVDLRGYLDPYKNGATDHGHEHDSLGLRIAADLTIDLGVREFTEKIASDANNIKSIARAIRRGLAQREKQVWIFFDSIDAKEELERQEIGELVSAILMLAADLQVPLRVILAGHEADLILQGTKLAPRTDTAGLTQHNCEQWLRSWINDKKGALDETALEKALALLFPKDPSGLPVPDIAQRLPELAEQLLQGVSS